MKKENRALASTDKGRLAYERWFIDYLARHLTSESDRRIVYDNSWTDKPMKKELKCPMKFDRSGKKCVKKFNLREDLRGHIVYEHHSSDIASRLSQIVDNIYSKVAELEPLMQECKTRSEVTTDSSTKFEFETLTDYYQNRIKDLKGITC